MKENNGPSRTIRKLNRPRTGLIFSSTQRHVPKKKIPTIVSGVYPFAAKGRFAVPRGASIIHGGEESGGFPQGIGHVFEKAP